MYEKILQNEYMVYAFNSSHSFQAKAFINNMKMCVWQGFSFAMLFEKITGGWI